jgi:hypothetical protein
LSNLLHRSTQGESVGQGRGSRSSPRWRGTSGAASSGGNGGAQGGGEKGGLADRGLKKNDTRRGPPRQRRQRRFTARSRCGGGSAVTGRWTYGIEVLGQK